MSLAARTELKSFLSSPSPKSRERVIASYAYLASNTARRFKVPAGYDLADLVQSGMIGLINAVDKYNPQAGTAFETFAISYVRGSIKDFCRKVTPASRSQVDAAKQLHQAQIQALCAGEQGDAAVASHLGVSLDIFYARFVPAQRQVGGMTDEGESRIEMMPHPGPTPEETATCLGEALHLFREINLLPKRQRELLTAHYQEGRGLAEIASSFGVSLRQVRYIHRDAISALRRLRGVG